MTRLHLQSLDTHPSVFQLTLHIFNIKNINIHKMLETFLWDPC